MNFYYKKIQSSFDVRTSLCDPSFYERFIQQDIALLDDNFPYSPYMSALQCSDFVRKIKITTTEKKINRIIEVFQVHFLVLYYVGCK